MPDIGVLAFVPEEWGDQWQPRHHVLSRLARYFHVVWMNPARGWRERGTNWRASTLLSEQPPGFQVYEPGRWLPKLYRPHWLARFTFGQGLQRARRMLLRRGCKKIVLYLWRPEFDRCLESVPFDMSCYHVDDEYSFSDSEVPMGERERRLIAAVDQVFIHSPALMEKKGWVNPNTTFVPNGVDYEAFAHPLLEPSDIAAIPHPRIGYDGWIKKTLDWPLLIQLARQHPEWSFVFVGENKRESESEALIREISTLTNVHFLGAKTTDELANYPRYFDVCIMPYRLNDYTRYIYPMKLHEYLASGQPTVASRLRSLEAFAEVVALPDTIERWSLAISQGLGEAENTPARCAIRQRVARQHDWTLLVARIARTIARTMRRGLAEKQGRQAVKVVNGSRSDSSEDPRRKITKPPLLPRIGVLALVPDEWCDQWQSRHHLLTRLARYFHVVWMNPAPGWREAVKGESSLRASTLLSEQPRGFLVYDERWLPKLYRPHWLAQFTFEQRLQRARRLLLERGCKKIVLYVWRPEFDRCLESVPFDVSCYHVDDEYSFSDSEVPMGERERRLIAAVDQVFIHSPALMDKKGWVNPDTTFVPLGADYEAFASPQPEPSDIGAIPHPRIGYSGWIKKTLDWPLLIQLARHHPEWSFVFVGQAQRDSETTNAIREMSALHNSYFLGSKSTQELIAYPQCFDVCIMPYRLNDYAKYGYPLKLHEYLASGRPTIGSRMRTLEDFANVVLLPETLEEWSLAIAEALGPAANSPEHCLARRRVARQYDWQYLAARVARMMTRQLRRQTDENNRARRRLVG